MKRPTRERERRWWAAVITFLAQSNGEGAFILEINDPLLDDAGPGETDRGAGRKRRGAKKLRNYEREKKGRESWIVRGVQKGHWRDNSVVSFFFSISDPCNPWREREVMGSPRFHSGHRLHIFSQRAVLYFSRPHDTITLLQYEM